jgi:hypothetical protein
MTHRHIFQTAPALPNKPYDVQSRVSTDSFQTFVTAIGGTQPDVTENSARALRPARDEFRLTTFPAAVADWWATNPSPDSNARLIAASFEERLQSHDRPIRLLDDKANRHDQAAIEGDRAKAARDVNLAVEQRRVPAREMWAFEGEIGVCGR